MDEQRRFKSVWGVVLILVGGLLFAYQISPALQEQLNLTLGWPMLVIGVGVVLLLAGIVSHTPGLAVPAAIVGGIGGLLYWQNATGNWESWAYAWSLIPGFVGVGIILAGLLGDKLRDGLRSGVWMIVISLIMFSIFGSFLGGPNLRPYWPALLIVLGLFILIEPLFRRRTT